MRKIFLVKLLIIISLLSADVLFSQHSYQSGKVLYGVNFNKELIKKVQKSIKNDNSYANKMILKIYKTNQKIYAQDINFLELQFESNKYILKPIDIMIPENSQSRFYLESDIYYSKLNNDVYLQQFENRGKTYLAPFNKNYDWKIKNKYKNILGFRCRKAILNIHNGNKVIAWFTPQIPVAFSPVKYYGLPGAILEITTPPRHIYAREIEFKDEVKIEKPTEGIKLTAEEYKQMMTRFKPD
jgi:GLPGLI family protein